MTCASRVQERLNLERVRENGRPLARCVHISSDEETIRCNPRARSLKPTTIHQVERGGHFAARKIYVRPRAYSPEGGAARDRCTHISTKRDMCDPRAYSPVGRAALNPTRPQNTLVKRHFLWAWQIVMCVRSFCVWFILICAKT